MSRAGTVGRPAAASPTPETSGLLLVDKPAGPTSHDLVMQVRRALAAPGAGHLGTLDPPATGLLVVAIGAATRCASLLAGGEKTYEAAIRFGIETDTEDLSGRETARHPVQVSPSQVRDASRALTGDLMQVPPMVSAIHVGGVRLHELARAGVTIERAPRPVRVSAWEWLELSPPAARARIRCSTGTFVRALVRDLGRALGCGAVVAELRRLRSEPWGIERAIPAAALGTMPAAEIRARAGVPLAEALAGRPTVTIDAAEAKALGHGQAIRRPAGTRAATVDPAAAVVIRGASGVPLAIAEWADAPGEERLQPRVVFPWAVP